jgi:hypothetical protein
MFASDFFLSHSPCSHQRIQEGQDWWIMHLHGEMEKTSPKERNTETITGQTTQQWFTYIDQMIATSLEPLTNDQPDHTCDWDVLTMHIFHSTPIHFLFKVKAHVCTLKMARNWLRCLLCLFLWHVPCCIINLCLPFTTTHLFTWYTGAMALCEVWSPCCSALALTSQPTENVSLSVSHS